MVEGRAHLCIPGQWALALGLRLALDSCHSSEKIEENVAFRVEIGIKQPSPGSFSAAKVRFWSGFEPKAWKSARSP